MLLPNPRGSRFLHRDAVRRIFDRSSHPFSTSMVGLHAITGGRRPDQALRSSRHLAPLVGEHARQEKTSPKTDSLETLGQC